MNSKAELRKYRSWTNNDHRYSDDTIMEARKLSLGLAPFFLDKLKHILSFITRRKTIDAKARIVK